MLMPVFPLRVVSIREASKESTVFGGVASVV